MKVKVRYTAIGSLMPDSISSVAATRSFSVMPVRVSKANTAAASVEPTIAPSSPAVRQSRSSSSMAASAVTPAHTTTPAVASHIAGRRPVRKVEMEVRSPPSSRMTAKARLPTQKLRRKSSNFQPPGPSSPASRPAHRKTSRNENPTRVENSPASTLRNTSSAPASSGMFTKSMGSVCGAPRKTRASRGIASSRKRMQRRQRWQRWHP